MKKLTLLILVITISLQGKLSAQEGYSSASMSMSQQKCDHAIIPTPQEVVLEEYINYHRHNIPQPEKGRAVALDARWGNPSVSPLSPDAVLQIGLTTNRIFDYTEVAPVNVSLVIDKSGSMREDNKLEKTKEAMIAFVQKLRAQDRVSIVTFDHVATVVLEAQSAGNLKVIESVIKNIRLGGSTNMYDGIRMSYEETLKNYKADQTNRIIVLTDAMTNTGVVDPEEMITKSEKYHKDYEIDFVMIGVGVDFNYALTRQIADNGKNQIHFIHNSDDIKKVFIDEVSAILSPVAKNPVLEVTFEEGLELERLYGYQPRHGNQKFSIDLKNMNAGLTQVVMAKFKVVNPKHEHLCLRAKLTYYDIQKRETVTLKQKIELTPLSGWQNEALNPLVDLEVKKNYTIAEMALCLKDMADAFAINKACVARRTLDETIQQVNSEYANEKDTDVQYMLKILETYVGRLQLLANND